MVMPDANGNYGNIASASVSVGFQYSKSQENAESSTPVVTGIRGGNSVTIEATSGDINSHGTEIVAGYDEYGLPSGGDGDISLKAGNDINLESAQATNNSSSSSKSAGASVGYSVGIGLGPSTGGWTGSANGSTGKSNSNGTTQVNTHVTGTGDITLESGRDTNLKGAVVTGETITADVGRDLNIISVPDTGELSNKSSSFGVSGSLNGGVPKITGVSPGFGTGSGETNWISEQSGLISSGKMDVTVGNNTHLGAGKIVSESGDLTLDTGTLTYENFSGSKQYEGFDIQANIDLTPRDANGDKQQQPDQTSQPRSTAEGTYQLDDTRQEVRATVGPGTIILRDKEKQAELEANKQTEDLANLNRDPDQAYEITKDKHVEIDYYLSDTSVKAALEAGVAMTQVMGGLLDRLTEPALANAIREGDIDPADALRQLQNEACFEHRGDLFDIWQWIVPSAYAAGCQLKTLSGKLIIIHDRDSCIEALGKSLYAQTVGVVVNREQFSQGLWNGVKDQGSEFAALVSDPYGLAKTVGSVALEIIADPVATAGKYGYEVADSLYEKSLLYAQAIATGDYEAAGRHLSGLAIDLAVKVAAPAAGAAYTTVKTADKVQALKKIEKIEKATPSIVGFDTSNVESKLKGYLLDPTHPQNQSKADWFSQALGFNQSNWQGLASQLRFDPTTAVATKTTQYGKTYEQVISITGTNGKTINTTFVFMKDNSGTVRLVTGIPAKK